MNNIEELKSWVSFLNKNPDGMALLAVECGNNVLLKSVLKRSKNRRVFLELRCPKGETVYDKARHLNNSQIIDTLLEYLPVPRPNDTVNGSLIGNFGKPCFVAYKGRPIKRLITLSNLKKG